MTPITWPSREEWAKQRRTPYGDMFEHLDLDGPFSSPAEIDALITALKAFRKAEGRRLRSLNASHLMKQPGEGLLAHYERTQAFSEAEKELWSQANWCKWDRRECNASIKALVSGNLPKWLDALRTLPEWILKQKEAAPICQRILDRLNGAYQAARDKREKEILTTPIDDKAWEAELKYRAECDPGCFRVTVKTLEGFAR
jgi:hypothetical protein